MEIFRGLMNEHSDRVSDKYISVNNFGYYRNTNKKIHTLRKNGRCDYQLMYIDRGSAIFKVDGTPKKLLQAQLYCTAPLSVRSTLLTSIQHFTGFIFQAKRQTIF